MPTQEHPADIVVRRPMNDHGAVTVELRDANEIRHVCAYATPELKRRFASLPAGAEHRVLMTRIGVRANVWRAAAAGTDPDRRVGQVL